MELKNYLIKQTRKNLIDLYKLRKRPFVLSLSGPSSSGKSTIIKKLLKDFEGISESWPSISRSVIRSDADRGKKSVQWKMLELAIERDNEALNSDTPFVILDRNPIDGYCYNIKYRFDEEYLKKFYEKAVETVKRYDVIILLHRYKFEYDQIRNNLDKNFNKEFIYLFKKYVPKKVALVEIKPAYIDDLYLEVLRTIKYATSINDF